MIPLLLAKLGLPLLVDLVGGALSKVDHPMAKTASDALGAVKGAITTKEISPEQLAEGNRHIEKLDENASEEWREGFRQVNATMRAEYQSEDPYVRRWRPTWGYITAYSWAAEAAVICIAVLFACGLAAAGKPGNANVLLAGLTDLINAMTMMWGIALTVLGVAVTARSRDKAIAAGETPPTMFGAITSLIGRKGTP